MSGQLDALVRVQLRKWPQRPPGLYPRPGQDGTWMRARPTEESHAPYLKMPGTHKLKTLPDGLWLHFGGTHQEAYVDILCVEACSSFPNLLDKRSRFAPSIQSLLCVCPLPWLLSPVGVTDTTPRWKLLNLFRTAPQANLVIPVRDIRVLFGLRERHYRDFAAQQMPHAHEFFCPMAALTNERGYDHPEMQALMARLCSGANFFPLA
jgi:hypothetical protein